jgi:integrase
MSKPKPRRTGQVLPKGPNRWQIKIFLGRDSKTRKKSYFTKTIKGDKKAAEKFLREKLREVELGVDLGAAKITLDEYLDRWLKAKKGDLSPRTYVDYEDILRLYARPSLGSKRLDQLRPLDLQGVYDHLIERKLSGNTVGKFHSILKDALKQAVHWGMLSQNPAERVKPPKKQKREMYAMTWEEVRKFVKASYGDKFFLVYALMLTTGMRPEEVVGLHWDDIDLDRGTVTIKRVLCRNLDGNGGWYLKQPKSTAGMRTIVLPRNIVDMLARERGKVHFVFKTTVGSPIHHSDVARNFKAIIRKAELPERIRLYDLRHTHATLMLLSGAPIKVVSERLGHSDVAITLRIYVHVLPGQQELAVKSFERGMVDSQLTLFNPI